MALSEEPINPPIVFSSPASVTLAYHLSGKITLLEVPLLDIKGGHSRHILLYQSLYHDARTSKAIKSHHFPSLYELYCKNRDICTIYTFPLVQQQEEIHLF